MNPIPTVALLAVATFASAPLTAQPLPDRPIPRAEVIARVERQFAAMDANHDHAISPAEFDAYRARQAASPGDPDDPFAHVGAHWFLHADANGDGRVTLQEAEIRPLQLFDTADANRDGVLSVAEVEAAQLLMSLSGK